MQQTEIYVLFELRSGKIVKCTISKKELKKLKSNKGLSELDWYEGSVITGTWSEFCCFDGTQVVKWKKMSI